MESICLILESCYSKKYLVQNQPYIYKIYVILNFKFRHFTLPRFNHGSLISMDVMILITSTPN